MRVGARPHHTCHVYLTDIRYREAVYQVLGERMAGVFPVFTGLVVPALARPEWVVEVTGHGGDPVTFSLVGRCSRTACSARPCRRPARPSRPAARARAPARAPRAARTSPTRALGPRLLDLLATGPRRPRGAGHRGAEAPHIRTGS